MTVKQKLDKIRKLMKDKNISGLVIPNSDPHLSEYVSDTFKQLSFMTNFTGSAGTAVVTLDEAFLYTDGRYFLQATKQLPEEVQLMKQGMPETISIEQLLIDKLSPEQTVSVDGRLISYEYYKSLSMLCPTLNIELNYDLVGEIWQDRPELSDENAFVHGAKYCTSTAKQKLDKIKEKLKQKGANLYVSSSLNDICYTLNLRGFDVKYTPVLYSYLTVCNDEVIFYIKTSKIDDNTKKYLEENGVTIKQYDDFYDDIKNTHNKKVYLDEKLHNALIVSSYKINNELILGNDLIYYDKTCYSNLELNHTKNAHIRDGAHLITFAKWLYENIDNATEYDCLKKLYEVRSRDELFIDESFGAITGYGSNAAIVHYSTNKDEVHKLDKKGLLLIDSGGQYLDGTTDITRTYSLGELTDEEKKCYTLVLKGHIDLAMAVFKDNVKSDAIDLLARQPLYKEGLNFNHGTGHSVGYVLGVHEGYARIRPDHSTVLKENMVLSNEPGFYKDGEFGIRIESLVAVKKAYENKWGKFLAFDTITMCPIDTKPIIKELLNKYEIQWLNNYHKKVLSALTPLVAEDEKEFLEKLCKEI